MRKEHGVKKKKKPKTVYLEDRGETVYSMAALEGKTPEEKEELDKKRRSMPAITGKERAAMIKAAFCVYGPMLLMVVGAFGIAALLMYLFLV